MANHRCKRDFARAARQPITAGDAAPAFNDARRFQIIEDLLEEPFGNILLGRDGADRYDIG